MKKGIHPDYNEITVKLADGSTFVTRSTMDQDEYTSDVDSTNHPFTPGVASLWTPPAASRSSTAATG